MKPLILARIGSHRARHKLHALLNRSLTYYVTLPSQRYAVFAEIASGDIEAVRQIKGITVARVKRETLMRCV